MRKSQDDMWQGSSQPVDRWSFSRRFVTVTNWQRAADRKAFKPYTTPV